MTSWQYKYFSKIVSYLPLQLRIQLLYFRRFGRLPSISSPQSFNEKLQARKIFDRSELLTHAADKIKSKELVRYWCGDLIYIPKTIVKWSSFYEYREVNLELLPSQYVIKANHTSQTIKIVRDGNHLHNQEIKRFTEHCLSKNQYGALGEWAYKNIPKTVFVEEFLDFNGREPDDYKFFVYHGKVKFIQLDSDRFVDHKRNMFDRDWNELDFDYSFERKSPCPIRPEFLNDMIEVAELIGSNFDFIRVDLYFYKDTVTFGELTVYPGAGFEKFPSNNWDLEFGKHW